MTDQFLENINDKTKEVLKTIEPLINEYLITQYKVNQVVEKLGYELDDKLSMQRVELMEHQIMVFKDIRMTIQNTKL